MSTSPTEPPVNDDESLTLPIEGMTCASCVDRVERALTRVPGAEQVRVNLSTKKATLWVTKFLARETLIATVEEVRYSVPPDRAALKSGLHPVSWTFC
jgi:copper chaperone CopZ